MKDPDISSIPLSEAERSDHVPIMVEELIRRLEGPQEELSATAADAARKHGRLRYQQGYTIPQILLEARILQHVISGTIHENLFGLDLSTLVPHVLEIGESLQARNRSIDPRLSVTNSSIFANFLLAALSGLRTWASPFLTKATSSMPTMPFWI